MNDLSNDPVEYWQKKGGPRWVTHQERIDAQLEPFTKLLCDAADLSDAHTVLDIGCGTGASTLGLASRLGPSGRVMGVDVSSEMLERARARAIETGESRVSFIDGDAQSHEFKAGSFHRAASRFGVMFFRDPALAFANIRRALGQKSQFSFVCWQKRENNPWMDIPAKVAAELIPDAPELPSPKEDGKTVPSPFGFQERDFVQDLLLSSGFDRVDIEGHKTTLSLGGNANLDEAVVFSLDVGPAAAVLRDLDPCYVPLFSSALRDALLPYQTEDGIRMEAAVWVVRAWC